VVGRNSNQDCLVVAGGGELHGLQERTRAGTRPSTTCFDSCVVPLVNNVIAAPLDLRAQPFRGQAIVQGREGHPRVGRADQQRGDLRAVDPIRATEP
jgi:hypothetical protein